MRGSAKRPLTRLAAVDSAHGFSEAQLLRLRHYESLESLCAQPRSSHESWGFGFVTRNPFNNL